MLLCLAVVLSFLEGLIPPLPALPPGIKLGLSNIVVIYCLFFLNGKSAAATALLKSLFVLLTRGFSAGLLSFCGGMLSVGVMLLLRKTRCSQLMLSICGAISHNTGQLAAAAVLFQSLSIFYYLPVLLLSGVLMGSVTATLMKVLLPALKRISGSNH